MCGDYSCFKLIADGRAVFRETVGRSSVEYEAVASQVAVFVCYAFNAFNASSVSSSYEFLGLRQLGSTLTQCQDLSGS